MTPAPTPDRSPGSAGLLARGDRIPVLHVDARQPLQMGFLIEALLSYQSGRSLTPPG